MSRYQSLEQIVRLSNEVKELRQDLQCIQSTIHKLCPKDLAKEYYTKNKNKLKELVLHMDSILKEVPAVALVDDVVEEEDEIPEDDMSIQEEELYYEDDFELLDDDLLDDFLNPQEQERLETNTLDDDVQRLLHVGVISFFSI